MTMKCGTLAFMAPEVIKKNYRGFKSDFWSLGVTLFQLKTGKTPFYG